MTRIAILGDTHLGARNASPIFSKFFAKFYQQQFLPYLKEADIKLVFQLGDLFDTRKYVNILTLAECKEFSTESMNVYTACTDQILKKQLLLAIETISTLSTQLKIVAAVKASEQTSTTDSDSEKQLVLCCQNLMNAIKVTIKASESASLRTFKKAGTTMIAMVKFKKALYKKAKK